MRRVRLASLFVAALCAVAAAVEPPSSGTGAPETSRFEALKPKLWSKDRAEREKAYDAYLAAGDEGRKQLVADLLAIRAAAVAACREICLSDDTQKKLLTGYTKLAEARKEALRVIFDTKIYPDADHGRIGQPIVDKAVDAVKAYHPLFTKAFDPLVKRFERIPRAYERVCEIDARLEKLGVKDVEFRPPLEKLMGWSPELLKIVQEQAEYTALCDRVARYNRLIRTTLTSDERKVVDLTNEYRMQLGLKPLAISEPLTQAARKHSQEMERLGYFAHESPTPGRRSPGDRCALEGYHHFRGENCASGGGPEMAFRMWYNSSGHHRNMLGGHNEIGVGQGGPWTEDFGNRPDLDLDNPPRTLPRPAAVPAKEPPPKKK
ncbi:MAG TPA: CAP domain-containing protein [Planctomycetota bacterium]|nr:CAP domain-containing protein [Planctomycetota bacterium]HRR79951.1 CAP domain-containing protein [Planctomycetota bacterium]HRT97281.1 CAP domain-containing protein [Planctomycetota bacterium]